MPTIHALSESDISVLRSLIARERRRAVPRRPRDGTLDHEEFPAPDVHIVLTPFPNGIPGLVESTDVGTTYGTGDVNSSADCEVYEIEEDASGNQEMQLVGFQLRVFNISPMTIPPNRWCLAMRTKRGTWVAFMPFQPCVGTDFSGFVAGGMNVMRVDHNGCIRLVQPEACP